MYQSSLFKPGSYLPILMKYKEFLGHVQNRIQADDLSESVRTSRAVLETLGERVTEGEATDIASPLPMEIDRYLLQVDNGNKVNSDEFIDRVLEKLNYQDLVLMDVYARPAEIDRSEAVYRVKAIFDLISEILPGKEMEDIKQQLPKDFESFFAFIEFEKKPWEE